MGEVEEAEEDDVVEVVELEVGVTGGRKGGTGLSGVCARRASYITLCQSRLW